jgi:LysR family transcriptional activator of nhaA
MQLNYKHLQYFWSVARLGTLARAARELHVSQPAISAQLRKLERSLGEPLFEKQGRTLQLTEMGRVVFRYAEEIFSLGRELTDAVRGHPASRGLELRVGVTDAVPKVVSYRLLSAALQLEDPVRLRVHEDRPERLVGELATHQLDLVLSDASIATGMSVKAFEHVLGECGVTFFGTRGLVERYGRVFPDALDGAPWLLPTTDSTLRRSLDRWFSDHGLVPSVVAEIEDDALLKAFGQGGAGVFAAASAVEREIRQQYGVEVIGRTDEIRERFLAISVERRIRHPAVVAVTDLARRELFGARTMGDDGG